ncbi:hypothetical protein [Devosia sp. A449]
MAIPERDPVYTNDTNRTVYTRESNGTGWFVGIIVVLALLAIGYLVFSANSGPSTPATGTPAIESPASPTPAPMTETPAVPDAAPMTQAPAIDAAPATPAPAVEAPPATTPAPAAEPAAEPAVPAV